MAVVFPTTSITVFATPGIVIQIPCLNCHLRYHTIVAGSQGLYHAGTKDPPKPQRTCGDLPSVALGAYGIPALSLDDYNLQAVRSMGNRRLNEKRIQFREETGKRG